MAILTGNVDPIAALTTRLTPDDFDCPICAGTFGVREELSEGNWITSQAKYSVVAGNFVAEHVVTPDLFRIHEWRDERNPINREPDNQDLYLAAPKLDRLSLRFFQAKERAESIIGDDSIAEALLVRHWSEWVISGRDSNINGAGFRDAILHYHDVFQRRVRAAEGEEGGNAPARRKAIQECKAASTLPIKAAVLPIAVLGRLARVIRGADDAIAGVPELKTIAARRFTAERVVTDFAPEVLETRFPEKVPSIVLTINHRVNPERSGVIQRSFATVVGKVLQSIALPLLWLYYFFCTFSVERSNIRCQRAYNEIWA